MKGKRVRKNLDGNFNKSQIKKGDLVKVITGDSKGISGVVLEVNTKKIKGVYLIVKGVNIKTHFVKKQQDETGMVKKESWIHISNVKKITAEGVSNDKAQ